MLKIKQNKTLFLVLLFFFIGLLFITFRNKEPIYYFTRSLLNKNLFFAKITNFKGNVLINNTLVNQPKNIFYKNILVQTGNNSSIQLYFSTKESIKIHPNSQILIKALKKFNISVFLKKGNFKVISKNIKSKSNVLYKKKITLLSKWEPKSILKKTKKLSIASNILKKTHITNLLIKQKPKESLFYLIKKYKKYFLYCQANALRKNINPVGKMLINLHIVNNKITEIYVISSNLNSYLQNCVLAVFKKITFSFREKQNFWFRYPLYFK